MKNKQTKKRLGVLAVILMLIVAIGATAGTTLAKYIYSATVGTKSATVAKWGFTVTANATELFGKQYNNNVLVTSGDTDVVASGEANVVAPGTSNANGYMVIVINGSAEVDAKLTIDVSAFNTVWLKNTASKITGTNESGNTYANLGEADYLPIDWKINDKSIEGLLAGSDKAAANKQVVATAIATGLSGQSGWPEGVTATATDGVITAIVPAGATFSNVQLKISWAWLFSSNYDAEDTVLGALSAGTTGTLYTSNDNGATTILVDSSKYVSGTYNLTAQLNLKATLAQVQTSGQS